MPGDLYVFEKSKREPVTIKVNGQNAALNLDHGYATLSRTWKSGDTVDLHLPMPIERVKANDKVAADRNRVALQRGPIVYCAEWPDSADQHVRNLVLPDSSKLTAAFRPAKLNGIEAIQGQAIAYHFEANGQLAQNQEAFTAIPYYAWANRGQGQMEVWIAESESAAHPTPYPTLASESKVAASSQKDAGNGARSPRVVADQEDPSSSADATSQYNFWPKKGTTEWLQYDFPAAHEVSSADVYWFVEKDGDVGLPASWRILYLSGGEWKPVEAASAFTLDKDRYNHADFKPVTTKSVRLEVTLQPDKSAGVSEWKIK
jgi:hypothetical protein